MIKLFRFRVKWYWYLIPIALALIFGFTALGIAVLFRSGTLPAFSMQPWYMFFPAFFMMIFGGGLEELGWMSASGWAFAIFSVSVVGKSMVLTWLYDWTDSILHCVIFHAAVNAVIEIGMTPPVDKPAAMLIAFCFELLVGFILVLFFGSRRKNTLLTSRP